MSLTELLEQLEAQRAALRVEISEERVHGFAHTVEEIGYVNVRELANQGVNFGKLVQSVYYFYRQFLKQHPDDAAAINNIGVFLSNRGRPRRARRYFAMAVRLMPRDRNIHENLRIADILMHKPQNRWHDYPDDLEPGRYTLAAYFDAHAM